jgi:hypothetical protein
VCCVSGFIYFDVSPLQHHPFSMHWELGMGTTKVTSGWQVQQGALLCPHLLPKLTYFLGYFQGSEPSLDPPGPPLTSHIPPMPSQGSIARCALSRVFPYVNVSSLQHHPFCLHRALGIGSAKS